MLTAVQARSPGGAWFHRVGREFFWVGLGQVTAALGVVVGVRLLTTALPPAAYGELTLGMTVATLAQQTVMSPIASASLRFLASAQEANQLRAYLQGVRRLLIQATVLLLVFAALLNLGLWVTGHTEWLALAVLAILFALLSGYSAALDGMQNAARQRVVVAWHDGLTLWLRFSMAVALISLLGAFSRVAMLGYALASAVVLASQLWFFRRRILLSGAAQPDRTPDDVQAWMRQMYPYAWPFATWGLFTWAQVASERWALQAFTTTSAVGMYAVLYQLGYYPITFLSGLLAQFVAPVLFGRAGDGSDPGRLQQLRYLNKRLVVAVLLLTLLATALALWLHSQIFALVVAPEYGKVSALLPWVVLAGGLFASGQMAVLPRLSGTDTRNLIAPKIVTAVLGIAFNFVGAYWWNVQGVVLAGLAFSSAYFLWVALFGKVSLRPLQ